MTDFSSWPTFPSGLEGDWVDADVFFRIDLMTYREPDRGILELIDNENCRSRGDGWLWTQRDMMDRLTNRQREVVEMRMDGCLQREISAKMSMSRRTMRTHVERSAEKIKLMSPF